MSQEDEPEGLNSDVVEGLPKYDSREDAFDALRKAPEITYANKNHKWVEIELPTSGVTGEKYKIKVSEKVPTLEIAISANIKFEKVDKLWRPNEPPELFGIAFKIEKLKNVDKFEGVWEEIARAAGKEFNSLHAGEYLIEARANSKESWQETTVRRIIKLVKKDET